MTLFRLGLLPEKAAEWEEYGEEHHASIDPEPEEDYDERFGGRPKSSTSRCSFRTPEFDGL
jgi:hypothetical protein